MKGVDPESPLAIAREPLVLRILKLASQHELVLLKGPAAVGKSSIMNLTEYYCGTNETTDELFVPTTGYTFMEKEEDSKPALEQLNDAVAKLPPLPESHGYRILFCDDIQNVVSSFWEKLVNLDFLKKNKLRIVGATTRRCASDPASPVLGTDALVTFSDLRLSSEEVEEFLLKFLETKHNVSRLAEEDKQMVINATLDQCSGHVYAIMVSLDKLDDFAQLPTNFDAKLMISHLLSNDFLKHTYTRIWPENVDNFTPAMRLELENAMLNDTLVSTELQSLLLKVYFLQDANPCIEPRRPWPMIKQEVSFKLSARRLYSSLFSTRAPADAAVESIEHLVSLSLSKFKRENLLQSMKAPDSKVPFPKEGPLQQMFFVGLTSSLPASTEVVTEMSAILPKRGSRKKRGELDFYVNSGYYYGIELMRQGNNFKEHKERFLEPIAGQPASSDRGKYFTPEIKAFRVVDFEAAGFKAKDKDESRLLVVFSEDYSGCTLTSWSLSGQASITNIGFSG